MMNMKQYFAPIIAMLAILTFTLSPAAGQAIDHNAAPNSLYKPPGSGPFPAVILLHGGRGRLDQAKRWAEELKGWGYVAHVFRSREAVYEHGTSFTDHVSSRSDDVLSAYAYVSDLPFVDKNRIGLMGFSIGGVIILNVMSDQPLRPGQAVVKLFRAAIAFYPTCRLALEQNASYSVPVKILIGEDDTIGTPDQCKSLVESNRGRKNSLEIKIFPNATHVFDIPRNSPRRYRRRHVLAYSPKAHQESKAEVRKFFNMYLGARRQ